MTDLTRDSYGLSGESTVGLIELLDSFVQVKYRTTPHLLIITAVAASLTDLSQEQVTVIEDPTDDQLEEAVTLNPVEHIMCYYVKATRTDLYKQLNIARPT